ncbi:MAG: response regulator transcription factor [Dehalococcoidales bacterium]|nr:response regulator transcription factor [Dehalococcoidales bacterium]
MRILLADDQLEVRSALFLLLDQEPDISVVGEASEASGLLSQLQAANPDLVLLDWELPGLHGKDAAAAAGNGVWKGLCSLSPRPLLVALSGRPEARRAAVAAGADGFVSKGDPPEELLRTLRAVARRKQGQTDSLP